MLPTERKRLLRTLLSAPNAVRYGKHIDEGPGGLRRVVPEPRYCGAPHPQHGQVTWGRIGVYTQTEGGSQNPMLTHIPPAPEVQGSVGSTQPHALTNP